MVQEERDSNVSSRDQVSSRRPVRGAAAKARTQIAATAEVDVQ